MYLQQFLTLTLALNLKKSKKRTHSLVIYRFLPRDPVTLLTESLMRMLRR